jgi:hypothetical protein
LTASRSLFAGVIFLGAFLLFLVEPMVAKQLLPALGGSAAVWITCLVFFQMALLAAYSYAHWLTRSRKRSLHLVLLAAAATLAGYWAFGAMDLGGGAAEHPVSTIFLALCIWIGLPFLALGATSPLLQVWWSRVERGPIPYRLFALSNLASLLALAAYPTLIELHLTLHAQRAAWFGGFLLFGALATLLTFRSRTIATRATQGKTPDAATPLAPQTPPTPLTRLLWLLLPMGASMQLCAVTTYITANIAPIPLLWILPLGVYLVTIIVAFEFPRLVPQGILMRFLAVMLGGLAYMLSQIDHSVPIFIGIAFFLVELFFAGLFCHVEAYRLRPQRSEESTMFYLAFAAGGALGSLLIGIVAPVVFSFNYDVAVAFFITALLALAATWRAGWAQRMLWSAASISLLVVCIWVHIAYQRGTLVAVRNFYAALRVKQNFGFPGATLRTLTNGSIEHGTQIFGTDAQRKTPTTYYAEDSGVGMALRFCCPGPSGRGDGSLYESGRPRSIGVIGLGAGTIAAYGRPGDRIRFYEINPAVAPIAQNVFTYIRDSAAQVTIVEGDARNALERDAPQRFDVLAVDAFSGDAIPLHLLTAQALAIYRRNLAPGGIIAFHISNQHVDLEPALALLAQSAGMMAMRFDSLANEDRGEYSAYWVLMTDNAAFFAQPQVAKAGLPPVLRPGLREWTDDYSSLLPLLHW